MMTPKRILFRLAVRSLEQMMLSHSFRRCQSINLNVEKIEQQRHVDIVTIAFNNTNLLEHQIRLVKKYLTGNYTHIIADNSSDPNVRQQNLDLCETENIACVSLPPNKLSIFGGSYSHACSLNWVYKHIIKKRNATYFGFIDHDLFPIKQLSIPKKFGSQVIYGHLREREKYWYLWSGLCFFDSAFTRNKKIDFMPIKLNGVYLDSGGGNWKSLYSHLNLNVLDFVSVKTENIREGNSRHSDQIEYFDDCWLHTINGSYWKKVESKEDFIKKILFAY